MFELTLYYFPLSSCSRKVLFSLIEKNITFNPVVINLPTGEQKSPNFLLCNPHGKVPVLRCNNSHIYDSAVILEFLEELFPTPPLLPTNPLQRAIIRTHTQYADQLFYPAISAILAEFRVDHEHRDYRLIQRLLKDFYSTHLLYLDKLLDKRNGAFIFDDLSFADIAFAMGLIRLEEVAIDHLSLNSTQLRWLDTIKETKTYCKITSLQC